MPSTCRTVRPRSWARKMINASAEFPRVKTITTTRKAQNLRSSPVNLKRRAGSLVFEETISRAPIASTSTPSSAGMMLTRITVWKVLRVSSAAVDCAAQTMRAAIRSPVKAPAVSAARCSPKARPRRSSGVLAASSASRGAERMPLPTRSVKRTPSTPTQEFARNRNGFARADSPYPITARCLRLSR